MGRPKPFLRLGGTTLLAWVVRAATSSADEVVIAGRGSVAAKIERSFDARVPIVRDRLRIQTPLVGLLAGADALTAEYVAALACDLPLVSPRLLQILFSEAMGHDAAIPRWPNRAIEPLLSVYRRRALLAAVRASLGAGEPSNQEMVRRLRDVRFVPVDALRSADPALLSFLNVNTPADLARARRFVRARSRPAERLRRR